MLKPELKIKMTPGAHRHILLKQSEAQQLWMITAFLSHVVTCFHSLKLQVNLHESIK